ncbi:MAG: hypothetical protein KUG74_16365 [Rhodobacteraceae bacterium]|nr:hypothetical protein [Paracoccaceae bacterium]
MFAPLGYTPLSMLWDQFLDARLEAVYRSTSTHYASDEFNPELVRGSPLDITEHVFCSLMWECWPHAASPNGNLVRIHTRFQDGVPGLFTQVSPIQSSYDASYAEIEQGHRKEINTVAGATFEEWDCEPLEKVHWTKTYPLIPDSLERIQGSQLAKLRFHTLPICFERGRFVIVRKLPYWADSVNDNRDQEVLVEHLGGRAICVADDKLIGWDDILSGKTPILESEFSRRPEPETSVGRPAKLPKVITAYKARFPNGHSCAWKKAVLIISADLGETVSMQTLRRAVNLIRAEEK